MKLLNTLIVFLFFAMNSFAQDLSEYMEIFKARDKNDVLVRQFELGTAPRVCPENHYFKIEYIINHKGALDEMVLAVDQQTNYINYKSFYNGGFPALFHLTAVAEVTGLPKLAWYKAGELPTSTLPLFFPESYSVATSNEKVQVQIKEYSYSPRSQQRVDSIKLKAKGKPKDNLTQDQRIKKFLKDQEEQLKAQEAKASEVQTFNDNTHTILDLEKQVNQKYIFDTKMKKKMIFNKGYEVLYLKYYKIQIGMARVTKDKINYQNKTIALFNKMIKLLDSNTKELEEQLDEQKDILKLQALFDGAQ
jgi:hypothetical protein